MDRSRVNQRRVDLVGEHPDPVPLDDLAEGSSHLRCREVGHRDQQLVVDPRPGDGRDAQDLLPGVRDGRDPREDDIPQPRRIEDAGVANLSIEITEQLRGEIRRHGQH